MKELSREKSGESKKIFWHSVYGLKNWGIPYVPWQTTVVLHLVLKKNTVW
jgi:hypothetical protein